MAASEQIRNALLKFKGSTKVNPLDESGKCVYTNPKNRDDHCIAGQTWVDIGGKADFLWEGVGISSILGDHMGIYPTVLRQFEWFTEDDLDLLSDAQTLADGFGWHFEPLNSNGARVCRPWGEVIDILKKYDRL